MNRLARPFTLLSVLLIFVGPVATAAPASEEPPVVRALLDSAAIGAAARPTYRSLDVAANGTITLSDLEVTFQADGEPDTAMSYKVATLILADVKEISAGLFEVGAADWSQMTVTFGGDPLAAIPVITAKAVFITQPGEEATVLERMRASSVLAEEVVIPEAMVVIAGQSLRIEGLSTSWQGDPMTGAGMARFAAQRIHVPIPAGLIDDEASPLAGSGYSELEFAVAGTTTSTYADEAFGFEFEVRLDGRDIGSLIIDLGADGIPLALFGALDTAEPDPDALLPFAQGISFKRAKVRFEDDSLTGRLLSMMAEAEDMDVESFVAGITEGIEMGLEEFLNHKLAREVSASLSAYLNDPKSITFALAPKLPVGFDQIMSGLDDPLALIELLQVSVTAND